jgi:hypothetical protein
VSLCIRINYLPLVSFIAYSTFDIAFIIAATIAFSTFNSPFLYMGLAHTTNTATATTATNITAAIDYYLAMLSLFGL